MIHNHEVPSSILGLATDLEAPVAVWLRVLVVAITGVNENECGRKRGVRALPVKNCTPSEGGTSTAGGQRRAMAGWAQE